MLLHLLDGTYELFRAYYGRPPRSTPDGRPISAVHGLIDTTIGLLSEANVTHLGVAFDSVVLSFRNEMFDGYKTGEGLEPEILNQFELAERAMEALGVKVWRMIEFEADDALAAAAVHWVDDVDQVVVCSPDKDLAQVVRQDRIVALDRRKQTIMDEEGVWQKFGVAPSSIPDYLGLVGDTADGIPGIAGWGAKSTALVLAEYGTIDQIPDDEEEWTVKVRGASRLAENLRSHRAEAGLYRDLAILRLDVPLEYSLAELEWKGANRAQYLALCDELGFESLKTRPPLWQD